MKVENKTFAIVWGCNSDFSLLHLFSSKKICKVHILIALHHWYTIKMDIRYQTKKRSKSMERIRVGLVINILSMYTTEMLFIRNNANLLIKNLANFWIRVPWFLFGLYYSWYDIFKGKYVKFLTIRFDWILCIFFWQIVQNLANFKILCSGSRRVC